MTFANDIMHLTPSHIHTLCVYIYTCCVVVIAMYVVINTLYVHLFSMCLIDLYSIGYSHMMVNTYSLMKDDSYILCVPCVQFYCIVGTHCRSIKLIALV